MKTRTDFVTNSSSSCFVFKDCDLLSWEDEIMKLAKKISYRLNKERIGEVMEGIVTGYDKKRDMYTLRSYWNAPDDIDGNIYFYSAKKHHEGDIVKVMIYSAMVYDLIGEETN